MSLRTAVTRASNCLVRGTQNLMRSNPPNVSKKASGVASGVLQNTVRSYTASSSVHSKLFKPHSWLIGTPKPEDFTDDTEFPEVEEEIDGDGDDRDLPELEEDEPKSVSEPKATPQFASGNLAKIVMRSSTVKPFFASLFPKVYAFKDIEETCVTRVFAERIEEARSVTPVPADIEETSTVTEAPAKKSFWDMVMRVLRAVRDAFTFPFASLTKLFQ